MNYGWIWLVLLIGFEIYVGTMKPTCRDGFTPVMGMGSGWYCAVGYKPN